MQAAQQETDAAAGGPEAPALSRAADGSTTVGAPEQAPHRALGLSDETVLRQFELLLLSRRLSERALRLSFQGRVPISIPSDGHEAAQLGCMLALRPQDVVHLFYRSAPAALASASPRNAGSVKKERSSGPAELSGRRAWRRRWGSPATRPPTRAASSPSPRAQTTATSPP